MKSAIIIILAGITISVIFFRNSLMGISEELLLPDINPELVNYLQGDWTMANDGQSILQVKRDSLVLIKKGTSGNARSLKYIFHRPAARYFTTDSSFDFVPGHKNENNDYFMLKAVDKENKDTLVYFLRYVSKSRLDLRFRDSIVSFQRTR